MLSPDLFWPTGTANEHFTSVASQLGNTPDFSFAPYESGSAISVGSVAHNAIRQELSDMYTLLRALLDLDVGLTCADVRMAALWVRTTLRLVSFALKWHEEELLPWLAAGARGERFWLVARLHSRRLQSTSNMIIVYDTFAKLASSQHAPLLVEAVVAATTLANELASYCREVEAVLANADRPPDDKLLRELCLRALVSGDNAMLPLLTRWMTRPALKVFLGQCAIDVNGRSVSYSTYNRWAKKLDERHRGFVKTMRDKAMRG